MHNQENYDLIPLVFWIGHERYSINSPLDAWRLVNGASFCTTCGRQLTLEYWDSPPRNAVAICKCIPSKDDWRKVVRI